MAITLDTTNTYKLSLENFSSTKNTRYKEAAYGDGYTERILDGMNCQEEAYSLSFAPLPKSSANTLETLLLNSVSSIPNAISWTPADQTTSRYFIAKDVTKIPINNMLWQIGCRLERIYIP